MLKENLIKARKKTGMPQEEVAEKIEVSRQTISNWESGLTIPDIYQAKKLAEIYNLSLDELLEFNLELQTIKKAIENSNEEKDLKINWTKMWSKKYPVLKTYQQEVDILNYRLEIRKLLEKLKKDYHYNDLNAMLVLKDILAQEYLNNRLKNKEK